jgi:hypothetical protein
MNQNDLTGTWIQEIPSSLDQFEKTDIVECKQESDKLEGVIKRLLPESERFRRWEFLAHVSEGVVLGILWPKDERKNPNSYGALHLSIISESTLEGVFLEFICTKSSKITRFTGTYNQWPMKWKKSATT